MKTGIITYNVRDRGRQFRGQSRNFDSAALAQVVNSPETQERVRKRDMHGFFGHWPRVVFGMNPGEGGIYKGKQITLEPALVTTLLEADGDGNIRHEAEFLNTAPGRTAARMFGSKAGGFSSAIQCRDYAGRDVPIGFFGFDYVTEPNYSTNRGYALDGVEDAPDMVLDAAIAESAMTVKVLDGLYSRLQGDYDQLAEIVARLQGENSELVRMLAKLPQESQDAARLAVARLDSVFDRGVSPLRVVARLDDASLGRMASEFMGADLPGFEPLPADAVADRESGGMVDQARSAVARFFGGDR